MQKPKVRGKHEKSGQVSFMGVKFTWYARYIKDPEHKNRYVLDQESVDFNVDSIAGPDPVKVSSQEIEGISKMKAKEAGYP